MRYAWPALVGPGAFQRRQREQEETAHDHGDCQSRVVPERLPPGLPAINTPPIHATVAQKTCA